MAVQKRLEERADLQEVRPGLYKSTYDPRTVTVTADDLLVVERHFRDPWTWRTAIMSLIPRRRRVQAVRREAPPVV
jgi:hypothetical protein